MKHIHLKEKDTTSVDYEMSVPEQTLRDLICITEDSIKNLVGQMDGMTKNISVMTKVLEDKLPAIVDRLEKLIDVMDSNTEKGLAKTNELIGALEKRDG